MTPSVALRLGRVSNLPTVWSNVLAGVALGGGYIWDTRILPLLFAMSLFYVAGMFLNDAFDHRIDQQQRPDRPIPSGAITAKTVFSVGFVMLAIGLVVVAAIGYVPQSGTGFRAVLAGSVLCVLIVLYDWHHKHNPLSPLIMGACRMMVYVTAAFAVTTGPSPEVLLGGLVLLGWLIGLTYIAKQENLDRVVNLWPLAFLALPLVVASLYALDDGFASIVWAGLFVLALSAIHLVKRRMPGDVGRAVVILIAGISLIDALFLLKMGNTGASVLAIAAFALTLALQRFVPGT